MGTRTAGTDNDSYFDELFLKLNLEGDSCSQYDPSVGIEPSKETQLLTFYPNPVTSSAILNIPNTDGEHLKIKLYNSSGQIVKNFDHVHGPTFTLNRGQLASGMYYLLVYQNDRKIGHAQVTIR